jgi:hypothetical protein
VEVWEELRIMSISYIFGTTMNRMFLKKKILIPDPNSNLHVVFRSDIVKDTVRVSQVLS